MGQCALARRTASIINRASWEVALVRAVSRGSSRIRVSSTIGTITRMCRVCVLKTRVVVGLVAARRVSRAVSRASRRIRAAHTDGTSTRGRCVVAGKTSRRGLAADGDLVATVSRGDPTCADAGR